LKGLSFSKANSIGGNITPAPVGTADQIWRLNFQPIVILRIFWGVHLALYIQKVN
jgi:hypothetical protein